MESESAGFAMMSSGVGWPEEMRARTSRAMARWKEGEKERTVGLRGKDERTVKG